MTRPKRATLAQVNALTTEEGKPYWVATDTAGRCFVADTKAEAIQMLEQYNHPRKEPK